MDNLFNNFTVKKRLIKHPFRAIIGLVIMCVWAFLFLSAFDKQLASLLIAAFIGFALFAACQWIAFVYALLKQ